MSDDYKPDIWRLQAQFDTRGLQEALSNEDPGIRRRAAAALRALGAVDAIPELETALETEQDAATRSNILAALATLQQEIENRLRDTGEHPESKEPQSELEKLVQKLRFGKLDEAIEAAAALGETADKEAVVPLVMVFNDPKTTIKLRLAVAEALLKLESAPVEVALLGALRSEESRIRRNAAAILGQLRAVWAVEPLAEALDDPVELVSKTAHAALRVIGTPEAFEALRLHHERESIRQEASAKGGAAQSSEVDIHDAPTIPARPPSFQQPAAEAQEASTDDTNTEAVVTENDVIEDEISEDAASDKLMWPRRDRKETTGPTIAPTRPLDPKTLEILEERLKRKKQDRDKE